MRLRAKILFIILAFLFTAIFSLYAFVNIHGKPIIADKLQRALGREVKIGSVRAIPLFNIRIKDIEIPGLGKIDKVYVIGGAFDIFRKNFILSELRINGLVVTIERPKEKPETQEATPAQAAAPVVPSSHIQAQPAPGNKIPLPTITIKHFKINKGTVNFIDKSVKENGIKITFQDLNIHIENLMFPIAGSNITSFEIDGRIPWQHAESPKEGEISASGWINLFKKDMQAKLNIKDIDAISLYPYYDKWVDLEGARIQKAKLLFDSDIAGHNGDVTAQCHLELTDIVFRPKEENESEDKAHKIATAVLGLFQSFGGKVAVDFTLKTKMTKPDFDFDSIRSAVEDKLQQASAASKGAEANLDTVLAFPVKLLEGGVRSATDISRALIDGVFAVGKEVKNGVEDIVQDRSKKEEQQKEEAQQQTQQSPQAE